VPEQKPVTPAYVAFKTFLSALDGLHKFLPDTIDATVWPSYSGGARSQLLGAFRFLRLINEDGVPAQSLRDLAASTGQERAAKFVPIMRAAYGTLMSVDLTKATPGSFDAELRKFGQEGETHRKAASFFLQAAKWAGVPLSPLLVQKGSLAGSRRKRPSAGGGAKPSKGAGPSQPNTPASLAVAGGSIREIMLSDGSKLILSTEKDLFRMNAEDRKFTMELLDKIERYEESHPTDTDGDEGDEEE